jgi:far upstream element-binding protein
MSMTGTREQIEHIKSLIAQVVEEGSVRDNDGPSVQLAEGETLVRAEMDIPSNRVGALIGRGGENITKLQADSGARLQLIQDETMGDLKLLKLAGTATSVAKAKELVQAILDEHESVIAEGVLALVVPSIPSAIAPLGASGGPDDDAYRSVTKEMLVPRWAVGSVIGRGGETIKRIQVDAGARVQFNSDDNGAWVPRHAHALAVTEGPCR